MENSKRNTTLFKRPFKPGFDMLPARHQKAVENEIIETCGFQYNAFLNRKFGRTPCRPLEREAIERIFERFNLNAWTGEYLRKGQL